MKIYITGAERSLGASIKEGFELDKHSVESLSRPYWDLSMNPRELHDLFSYHINSEGSPDVMIHNAGMMAMDWIEDFTVDNWEKIVRVNLSSRFVMNQVLLSYCRNNPQHKLTIVHIVSMGYRMPLRQSPAYCASKAGDAMLVTQMARECAGRIPNVKIFAVSPGGIQKTAMIEEAVERLQKTRGMSEEEARKYNIVSPMGRNCLQSEVVNVVKYAALHAPEYMSGHNFELPGGVF